MANGIDISNVVNVALIPEGKAVQRDVMQTVAIFTSEMGNVLSSAKRTSIYKNLKSVEEDFGTTSKAYDFAKVAFAQTPNIVQMGGYLVVAYWRGSEESVLAKAGYLQGGDISESFVVSELRKVSDGSFYIDIDGTTETISTLDFRTIASMDDVLTILNDGLTGGTATYSNGKVIIASATTGVTSEVNFVTALTTGTFIGDILGLSNGSGAVEVIGTASETLAVETKETAINEALKEVNFIGFGFVEAPSDSDKLSISTFAKANNMIAYDVVSGASALERAVGNVVWDNTLASGTNYRFIHSKANNRKLWVAMASRGQSVNFNAENSALTMELKTLNGVSAEYYTDAELAKAKSVGCDIYSVIKDVPCVLTSGANDFLDNVYNLIAYINYVQVDAFNLLKTTGTKIPQTESGVNTIVDTVEKTTKGFVRAGVFAKGTWTLPDFFGDIEVFNRNIEQNGYYIKAGSLAEQSTADRQARKSPVIQVACKNAGAIHSVDIIINFNI